MLVTGHYVHCVVQNVSSVTLRDYVDFLRRTCKRTEEIQKKGHNFGGLHGEMYMRVYEVSLVPLFFNYLGGETWDIQWLCIVNKWIICLSISVKSVTQYFCLLLHIQANFLNVGIFVIFRT